MKIKNKARHIPDGLGQPLCDITEIIIDLDRNNKIMDELLSRLTVDKERWGVIEWSLWSAALTLFFKQFISNKGRKMKLDYKHIYKEQMGEDNYEAYKQFKGVRDGYIAHASNKLCQYKAVVYLDEISKTLVRGDTFSMSTEGREPIAILKVFKEMINVALQGASYKKKKILKHLREKLDTYSYQEMVNWPIARLTVSKSPRTDERDIE